MEIGRVPNNVKSSIPKLQSLQDKRNRIAHSYGIEGESGRTPWEPITAITVEDSEILDIFEIVDSVSKSLDRELFGPLIGGFEIINEYHSWLSTYAGAQTMPPINKIRLFRKHVGNAFDRRLRQLEQQYAESSE